MNSDGVLERTLLGNALQKSWSKLDKWTRWVTLSRLRNSFLSRAITALSLSSLALANLPQVLFTTGIGLFSLRLVFAGSLFFLAGYVIFAWRTPSEFANQGEIYDHVQRMRNLADEFFVQSRIGASGSLLERMRKKIWLRPPDALINHLSDTLRRLGEKERVTADESAGLFHADLMLRQHDSPSARLIVAALLLIGVGCLAYSTILNVIRAAFFIRFV